MLEYNITNDLVIRVNESKSKKGGIFWDIFDLMLNTTVFAPGLDKGSALVRIGLIMYEMFKLKEYKADTVLADDESGVEWELHRYVTKDIAYIEVNLWDQYNRGYRFNISRNNVNGLCIFLAGVNEAL